MPTTLEWYDIALRLALTVVAGVVFGANRSERGRAAGLATTVLVCLAASVAMIQTNLLLLTTGKTPDSFVTIDLMRLPLGILTGMGFIGGGAILRQQDSVKGTATAASLWVTGAIGAAVGLGSYDVAVVLTLVTIATLWIMSPLKRLGHLEAKVEDAVDAKRKPPAKAD